MIPFLKRWEGGFVNDPDDKGGATMMGVTIGTYTTWCARVGRPAPTVGDLRLITDADWHAIFKTMYWDRWKADSINDQSVANILVDWVWASGSYGITIPQRLIEVDADGIVGTKTLMALNSYPDGQTRLFGKIKDARRKYINDICDKTPTNSKFRMGWMNRVNDILYNDTRCDNVVHYFRSMQ